MASGFKVIVHPGEIRPGVLVQKWVIMANEAVVWLKITRKEDCEYAYHKEIIEAGAAAH